MSVPCWLPAWLPRHGPSVLRIALGISGWVRVVVCHADGPGMNISANRRYDVTVTMVRNGGMLREACSQVSGEPGYRRVSGSGFSGPALDELEAEPAFHAQVTVGDVVVEG